MYGAQLTYTTPIDGIRVLGSYQDAAGSRWWRLPIVQAQRVTAGLDGTFDRLFARTEGKRVQTGPDTFGYYYYLQTGVRLADKLWLNGQGDFADASGVDFTGVSSPRHPVSEDRALGFSYQFSSSLVAKLEHHWAKGNVDAFAPSALPVTSYSIASFAVSF